MIFVFGKTNKILNVSYFRILVMKVSDWFVRNQKIGFNALQFYRFEVNVGNVNVVLFFGLKKIYSIFVSTINSKTYEFNRFSRTIIISI